MVPTVEFPPATPFTDQVTPVLLDPVTVALNGWLVDTCTDVLEGETNTDMGVVAAAAGVTLTIAIETLVGSATLWADIVKRVVAAREAGAV
jgi:hypothetical protein